MFFLVRRGLGLSRAEKKNKNFEIKLDSIASKIILGIGILSSIWLILIGLQLIFSNSIYYFGTDQFTKDYGQGISFLLRIFSFIGLIYFIGVADKGLNFKYIILIIFIVPLLMYQVKGMLILPILAGILFRNYTGKLKLSLKLASYIIFIIFGSFFILYSIPIIIQMGSIEEINADFFIKQFDKIFQYFYSGVLSFSYALRNNINFQNLNNGNIIVAPFWNILRRFTGWERVASVVTPIFLPINKSGTYTSNVFTIFGTVYLYLGLVKTMVLSFLLGLLNYYYRYLAYKDNNILYKINYFFNSAILMIGWFDYMYYHTYVWGMLFVIMVINPIINLMLQKKIVFRKGKK